MKSEQPQPDSGNELVSIGEENELQVFSSPNTADQLLRKYIKGLTTECTTIEARLDKSKVIYDTRNLALQVNCTSINKCQTYLQVRRSDKPIPQALPSCTIPQKSYDAVSIQYPNQAATITKCLLLHRLDRIMLGGI